MRRGPCGAQRQPQGRTIFFPAAKPAVNESLELLCDNATQSCGVQLLTDRPVAIYAAPQQNRPESHELIRDKESLDLSQFPSYLRAPPQSGHEHWQEEPMEPTLSAASLDGEAMIAMNNLAVGYSPGVMTEIGVYPPLGPAPSLPDPQPPVVAERQGSKTTP